MNAKRFFNTSGPKEGAYIVFLRNELHPDLPNNNIEVIEDITIKTYMIRYDEEKDF